MNKKLPPEKPSWLLLITSLPSDSATARIRIWRSLKAQGCASLRDGAYLLPQSPAHADAFAALALECTQEGGSATVLTVAAGAQDDTKNFPSLFDRSAEFAACRKTWRELKPSLGTLGEAELIRLRRKCQREFDALLAIDFFPTDASFEAQSAWLECCRSIEQMLSPNEPQSTDAQLTRLNLRHYQSRVWATRARLWIDRVASAWLIRRFIDKQATFLWLEKPQACPADALGFDFDGAVFTHVGERVTFETLMASFGLEENSALLRLAVVIRALDAGSPALAPEAIGLEAVLTGARERLPNDDALLAEMSATFDSLYAHFEKMLSPTLARKKSDRASL